MASLGAIDRLQIGIYGLMNVGKSTLFNRLAGQDLSIVAATAGTTTDPVRRVFEIEALGPVVLIDTAGVDDATDTELGHHRVGRTMATLEYVDVALVVIGGGEPDHRERQLIGQLETEGVPYIVVAERGSKLSNEDIFIHIASKVRETQGAEPPFFGDRLAAADTVVMVCPIDRSAPAGRLILPQVQAIRAALDLGAVAVVVQPEQLAQAVERYVPRLVVTDSQAFATVASVVGSRADLTSFSILLSELKGDKAVYSAGLEALGGLKVGDRVLVIENCSHQVSCDDIGRVKIPRWLNAAVGGELQYSFIAGRDPLPDDLSCFAFAVQCGGCMTTRRAVQRRIGRLQRAGVPVTNYGMLIRRITASPKVSNGK